MFFQIERITTIFRQKIREIYYIGILFRINVRKIIRAGKGKQ